MDDDLVYLVRRALQERTRASAATSESARIAHLGLAEAYDKQVSDKSAAKVTRPATLKVRSTQL